MATAKTSVKAVASATGSAAPTKTEKASGSKTKEIKYADKSAGQPALVIIFDGIKSIMKPFVKGTIKEDTDKPGIYTLVSKKQIETAGRKFDEIYFAGVIVQKGYVGFYYMPVYSIEGIKQQLQPELLNCLKGKSCFHIKKNDPVIMQQIQQALETGYQCYQQKGWV